MIENVKIASKEDFNRLPKSVKTQEKTYANLVEKLVREKYSQSNIEAIINNYLDDTSNAKYQLEFKALQSYRKECKAKAKEILGLQ